MIHQGIRPNIKRPKIGKGQQYKGKSIAYQLTYHHLRPRRLGGQATLENGACVCRSCHDWLEQLSEAEREKVNDELREYKASFKINCATLVPTSKGIALEKPEPVELEEDDIPEEIKAGVIRLEPNTPEEEKMLIERRKKVWKKFGKEYKPPIKPASKDIKEQNEFHREIIEEMRY